VNDFGLTPKPNWLAPEEGLDDYESGIGIALTSSEIEIYVPSAEVDSDVDVGLDGDAEESHISRIDFVSELPIELAIQVLAYLDAAALANASRVSRQWELVVANQHVWRESFLREKTTTYATSGPVKPGIGLGIPALRPGNDWREIYRVKEELDRRWKEGKARPVYLNGHSDSIYCLQFDEYVLFIYTCFFPRHDPAPDGDANSTPQIQNRHRLPRQDGSRLGYANFCLQVGHRAPRRY
jgi:F-box and WD-40 domain protein 1/11